MITAAAVYLGWPDRRTPSGPPSDAQIRREPDSSRHVQWYKKQQRKYEGFTYVSLDDLEAVRSTVTSAVADRLPGPPFPEKSLIRDLARFMHAIGAESPKQYLARLEGLRAPDKRCLDNPFLHKWHMAVTGHSVPRRQALESVLDTLWTGRSMWPGRPRAMSTAGEVQVAYVKPLKTARDPTVRLSAATYPSFTRWQGDEERTDVWAGPFVQGCPRVTWPAQDFDQVYARLGNQLKVCHFSCAVETVKKVRMAVEVYLYHSEQPDCWNVEWFSNYYPHECCWAW